MVAETPRQSKRKAWLRAWLPVLICLRIFRPKKLDRAI